MLSDARSRRGLILHRSCHHRSGVDPRRHEWLAGQKDSSVCVASAQYDPRRATTTNSSGSRHAGIIRLKSQYCTACDGGWAGPTHDYDTIANLFVEDGVWDSRPIVPLAEGREAIRQLMKGFAPSPSPCNTKQPLRGMTGNTAKERWNVIVMATLVENKAFWMTAVYHDIFEDASGVAVPSIKATIAAYAPYETGWAQARFLRPAALASCWVKAPDLCLSDRLLLRGARLSKLEPKVSVKG